MQKWFQMQTVELTKFITQLLTQCCVREQTKKYLCTDTGAGYNGKMFSMVAKEFGLGLKVFMGLRDIERQNQIVMQ